MGKVFNALNRAATTAQPEEAAAGGRQQAIAGQPERFSLQEEQPDSRPEMAAATGRWVAPLSGPARRRTGRSISG